MRINKGIRREKKFGKASARCARTPQEGAAAATLEPVDLAAIKDAFTTYAVLIFPDQRLSQASASRLREAFGPFETTIGSAARRGVVNIPRSSSMNETSAQGR
jgi:hypothetical protein